MDFVLLVEPRVMAANKHERKLRDLARNINDYKDLAAVQQYLDDQDIPYKTATGHLETGEQAVAFAIDNEHLFAIVLDE